MHGRLVSGSSAVINGAGTASISIDWSKYCVDSASCIEPTCRLFTILSLRNHLSSRNDGSVDFQGSHVVGVISFHVHSSEGISLSSSWGWTSAAKIRLQDLDTNSIVKVADTLPETLFE
jgi:hypothetical protein